MLDFFIPEADIYNINIEVNNINTKSHYLNCNMIFFNSFKNWLDLAEVIRVRTRGEGPKQPGAGGGQTERI